MDVFRITKEWASLCVFMSVDKGDNCEEVGMDKDRLKC